MMHRTKLTEKGIMRKAFEKKRCETRLVRAGDGYADLEINHEWSIWQSAWLAAMRTKLDLHTNELRSVLTDEEIDFMRNIFRR